jgi:hypothetical protein
MSATIRSLVIPRYPTCRRPRPSTKRSAPRQVAPGGGYVCLVDADGSPIGLRGR